MNDVAEPDTGATSGPRPLPLLEEQTIEIPDAHQRKYLFKRLGEAWPTGMPPAYRALLGAVLSSQGDDAVKLADIKGALAALEQTAPPKELPSTAERVLSRLGRGPLLHVPTGLATLDAITRGGLLSSRITVIGGEPDAGKTALTMHIGLEAARAGFAVAFHAADEPHEGIEDRVGQAHGLALEDLENGVEGSISYLADRLADLPNLLLVDQDEDGLCIEQTAEKLVELGKRLGLRGLVLIVDSLQTARCRGIESCRMDKEKIDLITAALKRIARKGILVIVTSELARGAYRSKKTSDRITDMSAFKGSGAIEYAMTTGLVLTGTKEPGVVKVGVPKNKRGVRGVAFRIRRDPDRCTYEDLGAADQAEEKSDTPKPGKATDPVEPQVSDAKLERARYVLRTANPPFTTTRAWETACGGKAALARAACRELQRRGEVARDKVNGVTVFRLISPAAAS